MSDNLSKRDKFSKRMGSGEVRQLISKILAKGGIIEFTRYCKQRMAERNITTATAYNVLERGRVRDGEKYFHKGTEHWRYQVETTRYRAVVTFEVETSVIIINMIDLPPKK